MPPPSSHLQVRSRWWSSTPEGKDEMRLRMEELLCQVRYSPHEHVALVGHSHLLRELFRHHVHPACAARTPVQHGHKAVAVLAVPDLDTTDSSDCI